MVFEQILIGDLSVSIQITSKKPKKEAAASFFTLWRKTYNIPVKYPIFVAPYLRLLI